MTINTFKNDKGYDLNFTLKDSNDTVMDITGATIVFKVQKSGSAAVKTLTGSAAVVSGPAGTCKYTVGAGDFDAEGDYYAEIEVTFSGGSKILTFGDILVKVKPELPR